MWKYYVFKIAGFSLSYLPRKIGYFGASLVADFAYILFPAASDGVTDNMRHVLGANADSAVLKRATRGVLRNVAKNYFDLIKVPHMRLDEIESRLTVYGWQYLEDALDKKRGVILVTAHLGSFDIGAQVFAIRSVKTTVLVESLKPPSLLNHVIALRKSHGVSFVPSETGTLELLMQSLRRGEAILIACDRDISGHGMSSFFFDEETTLPTVAVRIAMCTGAAVVPIFNRRDRDGKYVIYVEPAIDMLATGNGAVSKNLELVARVMEKHIRRCPQQWATLSSIWGKSDE
jgi:KDO2-lipid IV(A) lauroyltransferase